jgi:hypothetical protein
MGKGLTEVRSNLKDSECENSGRKKNNFLNGSIDVSDLLFKTGVWCQ